MQKKLKTVLITGAAKRVGRGLSHSFSSQGWHVAVHYNRSAAEAESLTAEIQSHGGSASKLQADLADAASVDRLFHQAQATCGSVDVLINNAALFERDILADATPQSMIRHFQINTIAPLQLMQAMQRQADGGVVINILDHTILKNPRGYSSYDISKTALWRATQLAAKQFSPKLRVNAVVPGILLPLQEDAGNADWRNKYALPPLNCDESIDNVFDACWHIVQNPAVSGQMIVVDSGRHLSPHSILRKKA